MFQKTYISLGTLGLESRSPYIYKSSRNVGRDTVMPTHTNHQKQVCCKFGSRTKIRQIPTLASYNDGQSVRQNNGGSKEKTMGILERMGTKCAAVLRLRMAKYQIGKAELTANLHKLEWHLKKKESRERKQKTDP